MTGLTWRHSGQYTCLSGADLIVIVEDIHWIDPSTLEVFDAFVDSFQKLPVLLIMTHRPGIEKRWEGFGRITQISLNRLGQQEMRALVDRISGGNALPESVLEQVLQRTDGVPLFVEELIKTLLESDLVQANELLTELQYLP